MLCLQISSPFRVSVDPACPPVACRETAENIRGERQLLALLKKNAPVGRQTEEKLSKCIIAAIDNPGGLFRAELAHRMAEAFGLCHRQSESIACAVEYFHIASLLLDDLPTMDDSMERRGRICPHLLYGEGTAILAALGLITRAYALFGGSIARSPRQNQQPAHECLERCLGSRGIVNGQARDLASPKELQSGRYASSVALQKTVPLIALALLMPALLAGASAGALLKLRRLAVCWGLFYQGVDDLTDILASTRFSGKTSGRDQPLGRPNIARQLGIGGAGRYLDRLIGISEESVARLIATSPQLEFLTKFHSLLARRRDALPVA
jgi:geranylgeranyl diphosphate synthase type II